MPNHRRILSLWFPHLAAERLIRQTPDLGGTAVAIIDTIGNAQHVSCVNRVALARGVHVTQAARDAHAMCPELVARPRYKPAEARFLDSLRRWAGKFSPWIAPEGDDGLVIDLTGCAHLFGGEAALLEQVQADCQDLGLTVAQGLADTRGAAWALARYAGQDALQTRSGDAVDQEARATRARAGKRRHWTKGGPAGAAPIGGRTVRIAPPGQVHRVIAPLPVAALRLEAETVAQLGRLGLRRIEDLLGQPRAALARRFGKGLVLRLDQATGAAPEPVSPAGAPLHFATRMSLPDPIGLKEDILAAIDRLLPRLCAALDAKGRGARQLVLEAYRTDQDVQTLGLVLARPSADPARIRPLLEMKLDTLDAGYGIDMLRLEAVQTEPVHVAQTVGHLRAAQEVNDRIVAGTALDDLIGKLGARVGMEAITRWHPADSHIPEKTHQVWAAAWSSPHDAPWPAPPGPRPLLMWRPEPIHAVHHPVPPDRFRWRGQQFQTHCRRGPERIAPEWWHDDPDWRSGVRDYWSVDTVQGRRLWVFFAHGATMSGGWFCQGDFG